MYRFVIVLLTFSFANALPSDLFFKGLSEKIVGGSNAELGQFPYQAEIRLTKHNCGGTILNNRWIVTAAHCVLGQNTNAFTIYVGTVTLDKSGDSYKLAEIIVHTEYSTRTKQNDIALLKTATEIQFSSTVQPLPLPDSEVPDNSDVVISGWGYTSWPSAPETNDLKFIHVNKIEYTECALRMIWFNTVTTEQICTLSDRIVGVCGGDSGSPVVYDGKLVGIVSWGNPCAAGYPDVHVNVYSYVDWIQSNMN